MRRSPAPRPRGPKLATAAGVVLAVAIVSACGAPGPSPRPAAGSTPDVSGLAARIEAERTRILEDAEVSVWLGPAQGAAWFALEDELARPSASAIKTSYMVELFDRFPALDDPLPEPVAALESDSHPAIVHFDEATREEIRRDLTGVSVRRLASAMIRGDGVSNAVYNAAANVTTAMLGGPEALTLALHRRDPAWRGLAVRRYMLARRDVTGDNEATAAALAAVLQGVASSSVPGIAPEQFSAMRDILEVPEALPGWRHFFKSGSLDSEPPVRILSGWWERGGRSVVYVVMATHDLAEHDRDGVGDTLAELAGTLREDLARAAGVGELGGS